MVVIIDYGLGNTASIKNMLKKIGTSSIISKEENEIQNASKLILPGVGHFAKGMQNLNFSGLIPALQKAVLYDKKPILGICLGMQLMTNHSEEGDCKGLRWIDAQTKKFSFGKNSNLKVPHMGWSNVNFKQNEALGENLYENARFYFVHSYYVSCTNEENVIGKTIYGFPFHSAIRSGNIMGVQFHPEKSHKFGMQLLENFVNIK